ncbi:alpha/beta hydrolase [Quadrisphaera sp. KR29]|uniref:alpha/beta hydrolase n=1 Tax=Quadrisphaera sp. KR29 TaxID=3461391 RepID=UPI004044A4C6
MSAAGAVEAVLWCGGTPSTGAVPAPLREACDALGMAVASWPRPGYAGRERAIGRVVADGAADAAAALDRLGAARAVVVGYSGGGPHALAAAAAEPRVVGALAVACPAPRRLPGAAQDDDAWLRGTASPQALRAALAGRGARERLALVEEFDPAQFTASDWAALEGPWGAVGLDAHAASAAAPPRPDASPGVPDGQVDDDLALVAPWGVDLAQLAGVGEGGVVLAHGTADLVVPPAHGEALAAAVPGARLVRVEGAGHVAVLLEVPRLLTELIGLVGRR